MSLKSGRKGRLYIVEEAGTLGGNGAGYGQVQDGASGSNSLSAAARVMRHIDFKATYDPFGRVNSTEKKNSPGQVVDFDRRATASLDTLAGLLRPSGTLGTVPECAPVLKAAFGSVSNVTLATTVMNNGADSEVDPTTTAITVDDATGLAAGQFISVVVSAKKYVRLITAVAAGNGAAPIKRLTIAPALPSAPAVDAVVKAGITYKLTTDLAISLAALYCLPSWRREVRGIGIDKFSLTLDANSEPSFTASGPAQKELTDAAAVADPTTKTEVGGNPPSGIVGDTLIASTSYLMKKAQFEITNSLKVRNEEYGSNSDTGEASEVFREGRRMIAINLDAFAETPATLHDFAIAGTRKSFFNQTGRTEGNIVVLYLPIVYWKVPDTTAGEGPTDWAFKGEARESADDANDEAYLGLF
jgi:hypothetical protein